MPTGLRKAVVKGGSLGALILVPTLLVFLGSWNRDPQLQRVSFPEWEEVQRSHRGRVLVVYVWASWCRSCVELLPSIVQLQSEYEGQAQFVTFCLDDADDTSGIKLANQLLVETKASFDHYVLEDPFPDALEKLDIPAIPAVLVFSAEGERRYELLGEDLENEISPADIQDAIDSLLHDETKPAEQ